MGCYLSKVDDKVYICEGKGKNFQYASASCQGWRREQEDAEICLSEYDENASLFILCDGHGGAEVAKYTVAHLPDFIKNHKLYKEGKYEELLTQALIDFDAHLRTDKVMAELERISKDEEVKTNQDGVSGTNLNSGSPAVKASAGGSSSGEPAAGSSSAGPSTSTSNGSSSVAEDVDTETLRREAQVPLDELINKYADASTKSRIMSLKQLSKEGSDANVSDGAGSSSGGSDQPEPSSSKTPAEEGPSSTSGESMRSGLELLKKVYMDYFDDSEDDSEFEGTDDSDEDSDDDGDDERDEETPGERSKKLLSKKQRRVAKDQSDSSSGDDEEEEDDDEDSSDDESEDADESDDDEEHEEEGDYDDTPEDEEDEDDGGDLLGGRLKAFRKLNQKLHKAHGMKVHKPGMDSGCTVVVALVKDNKIYVASAGDSRCIMIMRDGTCKPMSFDHKPEDPTEYKRIVDAGGLVCEGRVNGGLNLSRALGDFTYKDPKLDAKAQMITPCPDIEVADLDPDKVEYIFLACDGIWNSYDNSMVADYIRREALKMNDLAEICAALFKMCLAPDCDGDGTGCDNMTCILVKYDSSNVTDSSTNNRNDLKLSSTTKNTDENADGVKEECEQKQSTKRQADGELGGNSDNKRRCFHLLPQPTTES